jgi:hypothetical protein
VLTPRGGAGGAALAVDLFNLPPPPPLLLLGAMLCVLLASRREQMG